MRIRQPGKIRENLWFLGSEESCIYLLEGRDASMIINAGMSYLVSDMLRQFEVFGIDETRIKKLLILHAHFDHVGIVPFFKNRHPELEIYASARAWEILHKPKAIDTINEFSLDVAKRMGKEGVYAAYDLEWRNNLEGTIVSEGDSIEFILRRVEQPYGVSQNNASYSLTLTIEGKNGSFQIPGFSVSWLIITLTLLVNGLYLKQNNRER